MNFLLREKIFSHCSMLAFSIFVSGSFTFGNLIADQIHPELLTFFRFLLATFILGTILHCKKKYPPTSYQKDLEILCIRRYILNLLCLYVYSSKVYNYCLNSCNLYTSSTFCCYFGTIIS